MKQNHHNLFAITPAFPIKSSSRDIENLLLPPPNVTGSLHLGHAFDVNLYLFYGLARSILFGAQINIGIGFDHAGIATQAKFEAILYKNSKTTISDIGKPQFLLKLENFCKLTKNEIINQWNVINFKISDVIVCYTMNTNYQHLVESVFVDLYKRKYIYKDKRIVYWDFTLQTVISDMEIERREAKGFIYSVKYQFVDNPTKHIIVATTRPETIFADTCLLVNPKDSRYKQFVNKCVVNPLTGKHMKINYSKAVDINFGTGVLKCTPCHDFLDFDIAHQNHWEYGVSVIDKTGKLNNYTDQFSGLSINDGREKIFNFLKSKKLATKAAHTVFLAFSQRSNSQCEPMISDQFFLDIKEEKQQLNEMLLKNSKWITPNYHHKKLSYFINNLRPWCISRQLVWGHKIPVFYDKNGNIFTTKNNKCVYQEDSVLDTWFSSALWPFACTTKITSVNQLQDINLLQNKLLITGYDLLFFWVFRMFLFSFIYQKKLPFQHIFLHSLVRDKFNIKMSKSLGNGIDPGVVVKKYNNDICRMFFVENSTSKLDIKFNLKNLQKYQKYEIKFYNCFLFFKRRVSPDIKIINLKQSWFDNSLILQLFYEWNLLLDKLHQTIDKYQFPIYLFELNDYFVNRFCNFFIEIAKNIPKEKFEFLQAFQFMFINFAKLYLCLFSDQATMVLNRFQANNSPVTKYNNIKIKYQTNALTFITIYNQIMVINEHFNISKKILILNPSSQLECILNQWFINWQKPAKNKKYYQLKIRHITFFFLSVNINFANLVKIWNQHLTKIDHEITALSLLINNKHFIKNAHAHVVHEKKIKLNHYKQVKHLTSDAVFQS